MATTRTLDRVAAAMGMIETAPLSFEAADDVSGAGVLCAAPALLALGLLRHVRDNFKLPNGFYGLDMIFLLVAFLALSRVRSIEALRYEPPGEWGKLFGLDRIPEVKTLRQKLDLLSADESKVQKWSSQLSEQWMKVNPQSAGALYIDGHVRVYHGKLTQLPRRYVSRQRLCLRATTDYWVNAMDGQPFFVVNQPVDPGLLNVLRHDIIPRLKQEVPAQPTPEQLEKEPRRHRFILVFDREGYSPDFFKEMWQERIAIVTYHKFPGPQWPPEEFTSRQVRLANGQTVELSLAERGLCLNNGLWLRELRQREQSGHQVSMLATDFTHDLATTAACLFARWCQENFFKYMKEHYSLDRMVEYATEPLPDTAVVVNPAWRQLDSQVRRERALLHKAHAQLGAILNLGGQPTAQEVEQYEQKNGQILQSIEQREQTLQELKSRRKNTARHVTLKELPPADRFDQLARAKKHLVDSIKLVAYRAETALAALAREKMSRSQDARALIRQLLSSPADLRPNLAEKTLSVRLHGLTNPAHNAVLAHLCDELTNTETLFPGTELRLVFETIGASQIPLSQEV